MLGTSFLLLVREGFEAILIVGALMAFLAKAGAAERRREVAWGAGLAVGASVLTAAAIALLLHVTPVQRDAFEGVTMLVAAVVLFYVSYWLLSKIEADKWSAFLKGRVHDALTAGSGFALDGSVASGCSVAIDHSVASGCSTALHNSVASGGFGPSATAAPVAAPAPRRVSPQEVRRLATTGLPVGRLAGEGVLSLVLGCLLLGLGTRRSKSNGSAKTFRISQHDSNTGSASITPLRWSVPTLDYQSRVPA